MPTFGEQLRSLREKAGMTQAGLAEASGLPLGSIRNYEQGQREPYWQVVFRLAKALGTGCQAFADCVGEEATATGHLPRGRPSKARPLEAKRPRARKRIRAG
jgi:transcriptional regulator with XRE-family HTH domain